MCTVVGSDKSIQFERTTINYWTIKDSNSRRDNTIRRSNIETEQNKAIASLLNKLTEKYFIKYRESPNKLTDTAR